MATGGRRITAASVQNARDCGDDEDEARTAFAEKRRWDAKTWGAGSIEATTAHGFAFIRRSKS
jgi:hypothetical protein